MKDLLVLAADADAKAFLESILIKNEALGIRPISFDVDRHPMKDGGMVNTGAELTRSKKGTYDKVLLLWDHEGSGKEKHDPISVERDIKNKLETITWRGHCAVRALVPEIEIWLWAIEPAILGHYNLDETTLREYQNRFLARKRLSSAEAISRFPKELFEFVVIDCIKRTISPKDFERIGQRASIPRLEANSSFKEISALLKEWFPL